MRVLHVLCTTEGGGAERLVLECARRRAADVEVAVAAVEGNGVLAPEFAAAGATPLDLGRRAGASTGTILATLVRACRQADVIHAHLFSGELWATAAARIARRPLVVTEHNLDRDDPPWKRGLRTALALSRQATIAVSEAVARASHGRDVRVIAPGTDLAAAGARRWTGGKGVLAVGRRVPQKGLDVLLEAMPAGARLRLAGEGDRVSGAGIEDLGFRADVLELMALADVVVVPSRWEGFGLVALEAMAVGAPVIASAVDGLRDLVGDAGLLVPAGDVVASREAISRVLGDAGLRAELSARGRARAHAYDITAMVRAWEAVQRAAVRSRPASP